MKTITLITILVATLSLMSCTKGVDRLTQQNYNGSEYFVVQYTSENTIKDLEEYARMYNRDDYTTFYFFFHQDSVDAESYSEYRFSNLRYLRKIIEDKPQHGLYIMPYNNKIYTDGLDIIEMGVLEKYN